MTRNEYNNGTIIVIKADKNKYLALRGRNNSVDLIGKPIQLMYNNKDNIPDLEERKI